MCKFYTCVYPSGGALGGGGYASYDTVIYHIAVDHYPSGDVSLKILLADTVVLSQFGHMLRRWWLTSPIAGPTFYQALAVALRGLKLSFSIWIE